MSTMTIQEKIHHGNYRNTRIGVLSALNHATLREFLDGSPYRGSGHSEANVNMVLDDLTAHVTAELGWATYTVLRVPQGAPCEWYAMCDNLAVAAASTPVINHPVLVCQRCVGLFTVDDRKRLQVTPLPLKVDVIGKVNLEPKFTVIREPNGDAQMIETYDLDNIHIPERRLWAIEDVDKSCIHDMIDPECEECTQDLRALPGVHTCNILYYVATEQEWTDEDKGVDYVY